MAVVAAVEEVGPGTIPALRAPRADAAGAAKQRGTGCPVPLIDFCVGAKACS